MNLSFRYIVLFLFLFICFNSSVANKPQKEKQYKQLILSDSLVKAQLKIADSLSVIDGIKADSILTSLLKNKIPNNALWEEAVNLKSVTLSWLSLHYEVIDFLDSIINSGNHNPRFYLMMAVEYRFLSVYSNAISYAQKAILIYKRNSDFKGVAEINNNLIDIYGEIRMYKEAKRLFTDNVKLCSKINDIDGLVKTYLRYGESLVFENPKLSAELIQRGMQIADQDGSNLSGEAYNLLIRFYINTNQLDLAKIEIRKYFIKCKSANYQRDSNVLTLMAHIFSLEDNIDSTIYFNKKALEIRIEGSNNKMITSSYLNLAGNYLTKNEIKKANDYLEKAEEIVLKINDSYMLLTYYRSKVKYFEYTKDYNNAYLFSQKEIKLSHELNNLQHQSALSKLNTSFEIQQKNIELENELELRKSRIRLLFITLLSILFLLGVVYLVYALRKKNYYYLKLVSKTSNIEKKLSISDKERQKYQSVFEYSVTGILILDKNGFIHYANRKSLELLSQDDDNQLNKKRFIDFFKNDFKTLVQNALLNVFSKHQTNEGFKVQLFNKKNFLWLDLSFAPLVYENEDDNILISLIDVTQEVIKIEKEQGQKQELQTLLNSVTESILFIQRDGHIKALNITASRRLNSNPNDLIGTDYFAVIPKSLLKGRKKMFDKIIQSKKPLIETEIEENFSNLVSMYPNINADGEVDYVSEFVQDITKRRIAEEQIDNLKQRVLRSQMNPHFIFNSLTSIQSFVIRNDAEMASKYLNSFARLIRLILESSRNDFITLKKEIEILDYYLEIQKMRFPDKLSYAFEIDPALDIETIKIPPMLAQPFIENSIEHGIQHMDKMGELNIRFIKDGSRILFELYDNGIGRDASINMNKKKLFASDSLSTSIINDRLKTINKNAKDEISYTIIDLKDSQNKSVGTKVIISMPINSF